MAEALAACGLDSSYGTWAEIGREYSPVVYIRPFGDVPPAVIAAAMHKANASEVEVDPRGYIRAWWD